MNRSLQPSRLNMTSFAQDGLPLAGTTLLQNMERLAKETQGLDPDLTINWQAKAELRPTAGAPDQDDAVWLHLHAEATLPLICQRCMGPVPTSVEVNQWYRFVATEDIAMAEDDESEEDLLVMAPQFDLLELVEDELLMGLPLVPMHGECPQGAAPEVATDLVPNELAEKPNPFAMLSKLKKK